MTTANVIALFLLATRYVGRLQPLWSLIPARWRWVPPALIAAAGVMAQQLGVDPLPDVQWLDAITILLVALAPGFKGPEEPTVPPKATLGLFLALLLVGCTARPARTPHDVFCSDAGVVAVDESCRAAVGAVDAKQRPLVLEACETLVEAQALTCGDA